MINQKKNCYTVVIDGENLHVLEFFAVGNEPIAVLFFVLSRVAYTANLRKCAVILRKIC